MIIIGISDDHGASAAIMIDGEIKFAANEERYTRTKNDAGFPLNAIQQGLNYLGLQKSEVDRFAVVGKEHFDYMGFAFRRDVISTIDDHKKIMDNYWKPKLSGKKFDEKLPYKILKENENFIEENFYGITYSGDSYNSNNQETIESKVKEKISEYYEIEKEKIIFVDHHSCHVNYSYYALNHEMNDEYLGVTVDSWGDGRNQTVWDLCGDNLRLITDSAQCELARIYRFVTLFLNMKPLEHEYKVMGLAPYAKSKYSDEISNALHDIIKVDGMRIIHSNRPQNLFQHIEDKLRNKRFDNIARGLQDFTEEILKELFSNIIKATGKRKFVYSGGVAMNVKANLEIIKNTKTEFLFVPPAPDDQSTSIGACFCVNPKVKNKKIKTFYLGNDLDQENLINLVQKNFGDDEYEMKEVNIKEIAKLIFEGKIIARAAGRMEFGSRALGNRSIFALPSNLDAIRQINEAIKGRDFWMPFAGTIAYEDAEKYVKFLDKTDASYMTVALETKDVYYDVFKAATHQYDRTIRPQILRKNQNEWYYKLLMEIKNLTGHPILLNTSLNLHGYPIVSTAEQALNVLKKSTLKHMIIGNNFFIKN